MLTIVHALVIRCKHFDTSSPEATQLKMIFYNCLHFSRL